MKKILFVFLFVFCIATTGYAYTVCGPRVRNTEPVGTSVVKVGETLVGYWAVGTGCAATPDVYDVSQLCDTVAAGGEAICASCYAIGACDLFRIQSGTTIAEGQYCWCRRTRVLRDGMLEDSIGPWILTYGDLGGLANCRNNCAQFCADNVANNTNGFRNPLMLLTSF